MDVMKFVYFLSQHNFKKDDINDIVNEYKKKNQKEIEELLHDFSDDPLFSMKNTLHFTYPLQETFRRLDVLYEITGKEVWNKIFGYSYELLYTTITVILCRIILLYNMYRQIDDPIEKKEFEKNNPLIKECYFTKAEIHQYFNGFDKEIDQILDDISIDYTKIKNIGDIYKIIKNNDNCYLLFIWDFLYYLYAIYSQKIRKYIGDDRFANKRGKAFENVCFRNIDEKFPQSKKYQSLQYDYNGGNHEIDILMELEKTILVFECKSGAFDVYDFDNEDELYSNFRKVYGNGYKTINELDGYLKNGNSIFRNKNGEKINLDLKTKKVVYVNLSLYNIEFLQTNIQKIKSERIKKVEVYPICWNFIDFLTLTQGACVDYKLFEDYFIKRFDIINNNKNLTLDYDEVDAFGFLTDPTQTKIVDTYLLKANEYAPNIDMNFLISNGIYREKFNHGLNKNYLYGFINDIHKKNND